MQPLLNTSLSSSRNRRNPLFSPFASDSIWNHPIGDEAWYVPTNLRTADLSADTDHFFVLSNDDPNRDLLNIGSWENRASGTADTGINLRLPKALIIPDANEIETPNNAAAFLLPDGNTLFQLNATTRDRVGGKLYGAQFPVSPFPNETLDGDGTLGGHGGSGLSSIGGTIRIGELTNDDPIQHALKLNLWVKKYLSYTQGPGGGRGYQWPAITADEYANAWTYGGNTPDLRMGSLLAIPTWITPNDLGIDTEPARKLFYALQNYGGYVVDDTAWDSHAIALENGVLQEFEYAYGYSFEGDSGPFHNDMMDIFGALHVIKNNSPDRLGGGGNPLVPFAPPIDTSAVSDVQALLADPTVKDTFEADFNGDGKNDLLWRNLATGAMQVWLRDNQGRIIGGGNILPVSSWDWQIDNAYDVDGDGRAEVFWENRETGARALWHLDDLKLWRDPNTGQRLSRWLETGGGLPRIEPLSSAPSPNQQNQLTNGGFELELDEWNVFTGTEAIATAAINVFAGSKSLKLKDDRSGVSQVTAIMPGETYELTGNAKNRDTDWSGFGIDIWDEDWNQIDSSSIQFTAADWSNYQLQYTAGANAAWATVWAWKGGDIGTTYVDELSFQPLIGD